MNKIGKFIKSCREEGFVASCMRAYNLLSMELMKATCYTKKDLAHWEQLRSQMGGGNLCYR